ncbi:hypothetical protein B0T18DRAFT_46878 [Schizothecium vesticola]|uniref:BZIP domain-containing protein n=1 Tax=Schizothecium vesticola TaxID=314040 RepID=A0AA40FBW2_9PEZI|nr:hypothetical protein B0T18DRAFT_46878 [Schizothecium vesticola]
MNEGSYFEESLYGSQIGNEIGNDIENEAYQSLESREIERLRAMPPYSSEQVAPPEHPVFIDQGMGVWESAFPGGQFGILPAEPRPLFVDPELCDTTIDNDDTRSQIQVPEAEVSQPSTRRTSSSKSEAQSSRSDSSLTDITPSDQSQPKKRKPSKKKGPSKGEDEQRRHKFLERNRIAASKCREKKKKNMSDLEQHKIHLETENTKLHATFRGLGGIVAGLKHELLTHAKCNDPRISKWLAGQASRYVNTSTPAPLLSSHLLSQCYTGYNPPGPPALPTESPRSRNPSLPSAYHPMHPDSFPMGTGEGQDGLYDPMGAGEGQSRPFGHMGAGESQNRQFDLMGAGERQNSIAYSHGEWKACPLQSPITTPG